MKRKLLSLVLALTLCVSFFPATLAEGKAETTFSDVPAGSWYESGIKLCAEKGIMIGMGDGTFAPDKTLTAAECLTLALRLYDLCHGGKGVIEKAPENWDQITITAADGTAVTGRPGQPFQYQGKGAKGLDTEGVWFAVQAGQESLAQELNGMTATVSIHGKDYPATLSYSTRSYIDGTSENILFAAYTGDDSSIHHAFAVTTNHYWWADSAAMVQKLGLYDWASEESNGFRDLYVAAASGLEATARRAHFADSLATAAGSLPVLQEKVTIPDLGIPEQGVAPAYENILMLYRAGVLNGKDASGSFDYYGQLTRAEAATMVARVLDPTLRIGAGTTPQPSAGSMTTAEAEVEVNRNFNTYDAAVADLRSKTGHHNEKIYETPDCDIYVFDRGGFMNAPKGMMVAVYKKGSALGEGTTLTLPFARAQVLRVCTPADTVTLSGDKKSFTYTYNFAEPLVIEGITRRAAGTFTYTFDTVSGKVRLTQPTIPGQVPGVGPDQAPAAVPHAQALAKVTGMEGFTVEKQIESPLCTIVLGYVTLDGGGKDYVLYTIYKAGNSITEGTTSRHTLPTIATHTDADGFTSLCTDRAPDTLVLSRDGNTLFFAYRETPDNAAAAGVIDLVNDYYSTGDAATAVEQLSRGVTVEKKLESEYAVALLVSDQPHGVKEYTLYFIDKETGLVRWCILPSTEVIPLSDGSAYAPTTLPPNRMQLTRGWLDYDYRFDAPLGSYHDAGLYSYYASALTNGAKHYSGKYDRAFEEYGLNEGRDTVILFETPECSVLQTTTHGGRLLPAPPATTLSLLYKPGSAMGEGIHIDLPNLEFYPDAAYAERHDARYAPPHSTALSDDGKTLTYTYNVQLPVTSFRYDGNGKLVEYVKLPAGTYTYTVELATGEWSRSYSELEEGT